MEHENNPQPMESQAAHVGSNNESTESKRGPQALGII